MRLDLMNEETAFDHIVGGFRANARSRDWLVRWAAEGPLTGVGRDYYKDDLLVGGTLADLLGSTMGWWNHGDDDSVSSGSRGRIRGGDDTRWVGRSGIAALPLSDRSFAASAAGGAGSSQLGPIVEGELAGVCGAVGPDAASGFDRVGAACCCYRWAPALNESAAATVAGSGVANHSGGWAAGRARDLTAMVLGRAAHARAVLAVAAGAGGDGWRGSMVGGGPVALLVGVGAHTRCSDWVVRGKPWAIGPRLVAGLSFRRAVRIRGGGPAGSIMGGIDAGRDPLSCGLCGGALGFLERGGAPLGIDLEIASHPLSSTYAPDIRS